MRRAFLASLFALALTACASSAASPTAQRFEGIYDTHFETSSFRPDSGGGPYWLSAGDTMEAIEAPIVQTGRGPWGRVHLIVEGELSPEGHYGHLGGYEHELRVTRVIESRLVSVYGQPSGS